MADISVTPPPTTTIHTRVVTDFDAGINTSTAWTECLEKDRSLSDDELDEEERSDHLKRNGRPARALYAFEGKQEFREVCVEAGDEIEVLREEIGDGWSLVKLINNQGAVIDLGLLPRTYYTFTADFSASPTVPQGGSHLKSKSRREGSSSSITPRGSPSSKPVGLPLVPQSTGEWFPSFRRSLLGGKNINRSSNFVTSGAEEWITNGAAEDIFPQSAHQKMPSEQDDEDDRDNDNPLIKRRVAEEDIHFVDERPSWKAKVPPFRVLVHSPSKRASVLANAYMVYNVTSIFQPEEVDSDNPTDSSTRITVHRRFSHFVALHTALSRRLPGVALPPLPEKQYAGRFSSDFVEARRGDLERYIRKIARHPVARYAEVLTFFLSCENDIEWTRQLPKHLAMHPAGPSFYAHVFHPAFNLDIDDTAETGTRFANHVHAVGMGVQGLRNIFEMSKAERILSYSLLSLITSKPLAAASTTGITADYEEQNISDKFKGTINSDGAWCWREGCEECLKLSKSIQRTSEALQSVADLYDDHARRTQLATHEALKGVAHPYTVYAPVLDSHKHTIARYHETTANPETSDDDTVARCETVLNTTMAEMEAYHAQKVEDFQNIAKEHLDGEIQLYEQILSRLQSARGNFDEPQWGYLGRSPRKPSMYERELEHPRLANPPLLQPCPHVFDSAPMRPVSVAIQEGIGMFLGSGSRSSVFSKFW